jgi:hypothetical protein
MKGHISRAVVAAVAIAAAACSETSAPDGDSADISAALTSSLASFSNTQNSFAGTDSVAWHPRGDGAPGRRPHARGPGFGGLMGGGLAGILVGKGFGHGRGGFALPDECRFNPATNRVECPPVVRSGLTILKSASYKNAAGTVQQAFDSLTNEVNMQIGVTGTFTHRRDSAQTSVAHTSNRTVTGLAPGSTQRTINSTSAGRESTEGADVAGRYTLLRVGGDTIDGVIIPVTNDSMGASYPTAGTVIRNITVTLTRGDVVRSISRREVLTFNGTATATLVITQNGQTKRCTISLPIGRPLCG